MGGLYKGALATITKESTNQAVRFLVFEDTRKVLQNYIPNKVVCDFTSGGFAGFCSVIANMPVDVVKTKMQGIDAHKYKSLSDCIFSIYRTQGFLGFYMGIGPRMVRVVLDVALTFAIFHQLKRTVVEFVASKM